MSVSRRMRGPLRALAAFMAASLFASAAAALTLTGVASRKVHGGAGPFDLPINITGGVLSIEPRAIGAGHLIVFTFDEAVTAPGTVAVVDANNAPIGNTSPPVIANNEVQVLIADVPDRRRAKVTLTGVTSASGTTDATATLGFLVGSFSDSLLVTTRDSSACRARAGQAADANSFRYDLGATGLVSAADIATTKSRLGLSLTTVALPMAWGRGGWDQDNWQ